MSWEQFQAVATAAQAGDPAARDRYNAVALGCATRAPKVSPPTPNQPRYDVLNGVRRHQLCCGRAALPRLSQLTAVAARAGGHPVLICAAGHHCS